MHRLKVPPAVLRLIRQASLAVGFILIVMLAILWLAGTFHPKTGLATDAGRSDFGRPVGQAALIQVRSMGVPVVETAVGTVQTVHEVSIASKILAKVLEINVRAGQAVAMADVLVRLDDADLKARVAQALAAVDAAQAALDQARIEWERTEKLAAGRSASALELERDRTALRAAEAELSRARQVHQEATVMLDFATVRSPIDGQVIDKRIEAGDTATPGRVLVTVFDPTRMQLVASVRESLTHRLAVGQDIGVRIDALGKQCQGQVREIVPEAQSASRTFLVKVSGPCPPGVYAGMFGRLLIPLDDQNVLVIPKSAVRRIGQLDLVDAVEDGRFARRIVQLGREHEQGVQVLSGLREGESIAADPGR